MSVHTEHDFEMFLSQLLETNATLSFYCDFDKIKNNVAEVEMDLNALNYLLGKADLDSAVDRLWERDSSIFRVLPILIAVREKDNKKVLEDGCNVVAVYDYMQSKESVKTFLRRTGLDLIIKNKDVKNLVDYVFGVEAGLDSHARKNRSGHVMEGLVEQLLAKNSIPYGKEVYSTSFPEIHNVLGGDKKRFDFVVETSECKYLIEVNFYSDGGSKPNETARAYTELAPKIDSVSGYKFVWITDGKGWTKAKSMFRAAYMQIPNVYNLTNVENFLNQIKGELRGTSIL